MPGPFFATEWPNVNSQRSYPLAEDATGKDQSESFTIPFDFLLDLSLPVRVDVDLAPDKFFIRTITASGLGYAIALAYNDGTSDPPIVATATINSSIHQEGMSYALPGVNEFDDTVGAVTIGDLASIADQPAGQYTFDYEDGKLDQHCIRPNLRGVSSIRVVNNGERSERIFGQVELVAGNNMRVTPIYIENEPPRIRFDAVAGEGYTTNCDCVQDVGESTPIQFINGIPPNVYGEISLIGNSCLTITASENGLKLEDICSQPCCGCPELEKITEDLRKLSQNKLTFENFVNRIDTEINEFSLRVLSSKISDDTCVECP